AIGDVLQFQKHSSEALEHYQQALGIFRQVGASLGEANTLQAIGTLQEDPQVGLDYLHQAQKIYELIGDQYSQSRNLLFISDFQLQLQNIDAAIASLQQSAALAAEIGYEPLQQYALAQIAELQQPVVPVAELQQPVVPHKPRFLLRFSRLNRWHYVGLGLFILILVLLIRWMTHR
ncbi:MAG: hypothetical protein ACM37W_18715, partial [Actinomycetota bacterium]